MSDKRVSKERHVPKGYLLSVDWSKSQHVELEDDITLEAYLWVRERSKDKIGTAGALQRPQKRKPHRWGDMFLT